MLMEEVIDAWLPMGSDYGEGGGQTCIRQVQPVGCKIDHDKLQESRAVGL